MPHRDSVDQLEAAVLARIARHRADADDRAALPAGALLVFAALTAGLIIGFGRAQHPVAPGGGAESIVLADSARMAPSGLLASAQ